MSQSSDPLYRGTPYLEDLSSQLGQEFSEMVRKEIQQFKSRRQDLEIAVEEEHGDEDGGVSAERAATILKKIPKVLRHTGAFVAGPSVLPRGETTELPFVLRSGSGDRYVVGSVVVHTEIGGTWKMIGYSSNRGIPRRLNREVRSYDPDDLQQAMGSVDGILKSIDRAAGTYIQLDEQRSSASSAGVASLIGEEDVSLDDPGLFPGDSSSGSSSSGGTSKPSSGSASRQKSSSRQSTLRNRVQRLLGDKKGAGKKIVQDKTGRKIKDKEVFNRLRKDSYLDAAPRWFQRVKNKRGEDEKLFRRFLSIATKVFNKVKMQDREWTISEFWKSLGKNLKRNGVLDQNYCWKTHRELDLESSGACPFRNQCSSHQEGEDGKCVHRSYDV